MERKERGSEVERLVSQAEIVVDLRKSVWLPVENRYSTDPNLGCLARCSPWRSQVSRHQPHTA